jgi:N-glycosidase YbiA
MYRTFIFFRSNLSSVSPAVTLWWPRKVVTLLNRLPVGALHYGACASWACADFIAACRSAPGAASRGIEVENLRLRWGRLDQVEGNPETQEYVEQWRGRLFEEIERLSADAGGRRWLPVKLDLNPPYHATRGDTVLCRRLMGEYREGGPEWVQVAESTGVVTFARYGTEYGEFSNSAPYPIRIDGQMWHSVDHYVQAQTFAVEAYREKIRAADVILAPRLARDQEQTVRPDWEAVQIGVLRAALLAKFTQYGELRDLLLSTDDAELVDHTEDDRGGGSDTNLLGRALMEVRESLRAPENAEPGAAADRAGGGRFGG